MPSSLYLSSVELQKNLDRIKIVEWGPVFHYKTTSTFEFDFIPQPNFNKNFELLFYTLDKENITISLAQKSQSCAQILSVEKSKLNNYYFVQVSLLSQPKENVVFFEIEKGLLWATNCCGTKFNIPWPRWSVYIASNPNHVDWTTGWDDSLNKDYLLLTKK